MRQLTELVNLCWGLSLTLFWDVTSTINPLCATYHIRSTYKSKIIFIQNPYYYILIIPVQLNCVFRAFNGIKGESYSTSNGTFVPLEMYSVEWQNLRDLSQILNALGGPRGGRETAKVARARLNNCDGKLERGIRRWERRFRRPLIRPAFASIRNASQFKPFYLNTNPRRGFATTKRKLGQ